MYFRPFIFLVFISGALGALISANDFLKANSTLIRNNSGQGEAVLLKGINLGGWLLMEKWMTPMGNGIIDAFQLRDVLSGRFGQTEMEKLIGVYESVWIRAEDLDNIQALVRFAIIC